eukprot:scaffold6247_cov256-Pinguiococcus_pyrenoidosus.AAC.8
MSEVDKADEALLPEVGCQLLQHRADGRPVGTKQRRGKATSARGSGRVATDANDATNTTRREP